MFIALFIKNNAVRLSRCDFQENKVSKVRVSFYDLDLLEILSTFYFTRQQSYEMSFTYFYIILH